MPSQKAPDYDEVSLYLDKHLNRYFKVPSVRDLRTAFSDRGSISTYHDYLRRWNASRRSLPGIAAAILAIEAELKAHAMTISLSLERLRQALQLAFASDVEVSKTDSHLCEDVMDYDQVD